MIFQTRASCGVIAILVCVLAGRCQAQLAVRPLAQNPCSGRSSCHECIQTTGCGWCYAPDYGRPRCFSPHMDGYGNCSEEYMVNPDNFFSVVTSKPLSRGKNGGRIGWGYAESASTEKSGSDVGIGGSSAPTEDLVQIMPQRVKLQLRPNQMQNLQIAYAQAQDYPVDLYYLMDLSYSMKDDKENLNLLGDLLAETMRNITSDFRIGFGSFIDKFVRPFTDPMGSHSSCDGCAVYYGFHNAMRLGTDSKHFTKAVSDSTVHGNLDTPEGGFDAIMQAIACKSEIGWRDRARRLLVFSTDAPSHVAGDGKLGGISLPNDGKCHLDSKSTYTHSTIQDYPSVSHINVKVKEHSINLIFAVTNDQIEYYKQLSERIEGSSWGELTADSSNVAGLVKHQYDKITSAVEIRDTSSKVVHIVYKSACLGQHEENVTVTNKCDGLKVGDVVQFTAEITLKECPIDSREWKQTFKIYPVGISEGLIVDLEMICDCPCEHEGHHSYRQTPDVCSGQGVLACGVCLCNPGRFGKNCECSAAHSLPELERGCRPQNSLTGPLCSNRGTCTCGQCECDKLDDPEKVISGPYCECDNFTCDLNRGLMCSGPDHGQCVCGSCMCNPSFTGSACDCSLDRTSCIAPENGKVCSDNGQCICGQCVCNVGGDRHYSGKYCENCPTCPRKCAEFKDCVLCEVHKRGPRLDSNATEPHCWSCSLHPLIEEGKVEANESRGEHLCSFFDDEDCLYVYVYSYDENSRLVIRAQKLRECPPKVSVLGIIAGAVTGVLLTGLSLLMLWKVVTTIQDRREFAKFEKERALGQWQESGNPIYHSAITTFNNPTFRQQ